MKAIGLIVMRDVRLAARQGWQIVTALLFFLLVIVLLAFGIGPDPALLRLVAPGAVWVAALLASLLSLDRMFAADHEDGSLDLLLASPASAEGIAIAKMLAHWLVTGLPLTLISPLAGLLLRMPAEAVGAMVLCLLLGTPTLSLTGGAIAALMVGARRGGMLIALLALPLFVPVLIFGAGALDKALAGGSIGGTLAFLGALFAVALPLAPIAAAASLRE
jgi:heme exporter protein B